MTKKSWILGALLLVCGAVSAQRSLTLDECRQMAIEGSNGLQQAQQKVQMAEYDRKAAVANYFPNISIKGAYLFNSKNLSLTGEDLSNSLNGLGTNVQKALGDQTTQLMSSIMSNPQALAEYMSSPMWQTVLGSLSQVDVSEALNAQGKAINDAFQLDIQNCVMGVAVLEQPLCMGGKIVAANRIAKLARELADAQYDQKYQDILVEVDEAYWQIVTVAAKERLALKNDSLMHNILNDVEAAVAEGTMTEADALGVRVKVNEADLLLTQARNGLKLSKMLLCKRVGLPLDTDITLADEEDGGMTLPVLTDDKPLDDIYRDRPEIRSLELASGIYKNKVAVERSEMIPKVMLTADYLISNPNAIDGFQNSWDGMFNVGVVVDIPIMHGTEHLQKTRKAKAEARLYELQVDDAKEMIQLQVSQLRYQRDELQKKLSMVESSSRSAEENMRVASVGVTEGVVPVETLFAAQTAWLKARSEDVDTHVELQMVCARLNQAEGRYAK